MVGSVTAAPNADLEAVRNADVEWDRFGSNDYFQRNYRSLHPEDGQILREAGAFLAQHFRPGEIAGDAVDVGAGTNLYPALLMLPWSSSITLTDYAHSNVAWLSESVRPDAESAWPWQPFWDQIAGLPGYRDLTDPRELLASRSKIAQHNIFRLPRACWDLGSLFFADGITEDTDEFATAVEAFVRALRPGAPFVAAFMANSEGYAVDGQPYPSVSIEKKYLESLFAALPTQGVQVGKTDRTDQVVRPGYDGMLLATGTAGC